MASVKIEGIISDLKSFTKVLGEYYSSLIDYFSNSSTDLVNLSEKIEEISYSNIVESAMNTKDSSTGFDRGAISDSVYKIAALERELSIRSDSKLDYYLQAESDLKISINKLLANEGLTLNRLRGTNVE